MTTATQAPARQQPPSRPGGGVGFVRQFLATAGMMPLFLLLFAAACIWVPYFNSARNFTGLALSVATVGTIACTMLFCLAAGDFDLSVGSVVAMSGVVAAVVVNGTGSVVLGVAAGAAAGAVVGLVNGVVIARLGINALITTLATMQIVRGLAYLIAKQSVGGSSIGVDSARFCALGIGSFGIGTWQVPIPVWIMAGCFVLFGLLLNRTTFGRNTLAVGGNAEAARLAGISVGRIKISIFALQGLLAGFVGVILAARLSLAESKTAEGLELAVISACVLGGVSLSGGIGTISGVISGVLIMGTLQNIMDLRQIDPLWQYVVRGSVLLAAVLLDRMKR